MLDRATARHKLVEHALRRRRRQELILLEQQRRQHCAEIDRGWAFGRHGDWLKSLAARLVAHAKLASPTDESPAQGKGRLDLAWRKGRRWIRGVLLGASRGTFRHRDWAAPR